MIKNILRFAIILMVAGACSPSQKVPNGPPQWAGEVVWYQIFVERFHNGDPTNDPTPADISTLTQIFPVPENWSITPWTSDWWEQESWGKEAGVHFRSSLQHRRYGGDLQGIINKLDYLQDLGVTAIYLNPVNDAASLHKYDARNYHHIDVNFGPDPAGDKKIMESEDPSDPSTWQWTSADRLFLQLVEMLHQRGMKVILDYSWNHTGTEFWAWKDILRNQEKSVYKDWYEIHQFDHPDTPENEFSYTGWAGVSSLPELKKTADVSRRVTGQPFAGNIHPPVKKHIFDVTRRWLAPNGDITKGIDGFRLDVAEQVPMEFWKEYRGFVKSINPEAYLVGEVWWEKWPDHLANPAPYVNDEVFDAVMFYQIYKPARNFFLQGPGALTSAQLADSLLFEWNRLPEAFRNAQMNVNCTHDSPRLLTCFANKGKYKYHVNPYENPDCITGRPDDETYRRVKLYLAHLFTLPGSPSVWNGDEMGMWGTDDPDNRKPLWWPEMTFMPETRNSILPGEKTYDMPGFDSNMHQYVKQMVQIRKQNPVLISGKLEFLSSPDNILLYKRTDGNNQIIVAINVGSEAGEISTGDDKPMTDLLNGDGIQGTRTIIPPMTAYILKNHP